MGSNSSSPQKTRSHLDDANNVQLTLKVPAPNFSAVNIDENNDSTELLGVGAFARVYKIKVTINGLVQTVGLMHCTVTHTNTTAFSWS